MKILVAVSLALSIAAFIVGGTWAVLIAVVAVVLGAIHQARR